MTTYLFTNSKRTKILATTVVEVKRGMPVNTALRHEKKLAKKLNQKVTTWVLVGKEKI